MGTMRERQREVQLCRRQVPVAGARRRVAWRRGSGHGFWRRSLGVTTVDAASRRACHGRSGSDGSVTLAACPALPGRRLRAATCRSPSVRRSRCSAPRTLGVREIARRIGRDPATISRELRRNAATRTRQARLPGRRWRSGRRSAGRRPKTAKLVTNDRLREYVQDRLAGSVRRPDGTIVAGPPRRRGRG